VPVPNTNNAATVYPPQNDWRFSWLFTGQQTDALAGTVFDGQVVVYENRQFAYDQVQSPFGGQIPKPADETVVEAVFGNGKNVQIIANNRGYARAAKRNVLLRWPSSVPDPDVKVGQWIADVTYERRQNLAVQNFGPPFLFPAQRCYWYQISKRTEPGPDTALGANYRSMTVWVNSDLRAQSILDNTGNPVNVEAALIAPSVVNVIPVTIYTR
jgi:hypothetical protein